MFSYLLSLMLTLSPLAAGGKGHHYGWSRNSADAPPPPPPVTLVSHPGDSSGGPSYGPPSGGPDPGTFKYGN
jgi:hypothetical protein